MWRVKIKKNSQVSMEPLTLHVTLYVAFRNEISLVGDPFIK